MRRWWIAVLLLAGAAWWFLRDGDGVDAVQPAAPAAQRGEARVEVDEPIESAQAPAVRSAADKHEDAPAPHFTEDAPPTSPARLTIHAYLPDGRPWSGAQLELSADGAPLAGPIPMASGRERTPGVVFRAIAGAHQTLFLLADEQGEVVLAPVTPDLELRLEARDAVGTVDASVDGIELGPGEQRGVEVWLTRYPRTLRGRCVDELGRLLPEVEVRVDGSESGLPLETGEDGTFELTPVFAPSVTVRATLDDAIAVETFDVPAGDATVQVVLRPGRRVVVDTVDDEGRAVSGIEVSAHDVGSEAPLDHSYTLVATSQVLTLLPHRTLELRWGAPCAPRSQTIDATTERVRLVTERPGWLDVEVGTLPGGLEATYAVRVLCADGVTEAASPRGILNSGHQRLRWRLPPGRYGLQLLHLSDRPTADWETWGAQEPVEVFAGQTTVARLGG